MPAGRLNKRVRFERARRSADAAGGADRSWEHLLTVWGGLRLDRGRERVEAGRVESATAGTLTIRVSRSAETLMTSDRVMIDGAPWNIRSITNEDQHRKFLTMVVERGVAT